MFQHKADMVDENFLYFGYLSQSFHMDIHGVAFFFECFFPIFGDVILGMISSYEDWKEALEKEGYTVNVHMEGLGQVPEIQEIFINHIRFMLKHRILNIMEKKAGYAAGKDVE